MIKIQDDIKQNKIYLKEAKKELLEAKKRRL